MTSKIIICMGSSCFARGNSVNLKIIEDFLAENKLETTVELSGSRCNANCCDGPVIKIDNQSYRCVDSGMMLDILRNTFLQPNGK